jgi:hypothetical protein
MWLTRDRWAADQALLRRPASDYFLPFFFAAFFAGAFFFAAAMVHLSSVLRPLNRPLRKVGASDHPVEEDLYGRSDTRCAARVSVPSPFPSRGIGKAEAELDQAMRDGLECRASWPRTDRLQPVGAGMRKRDAS